MTEVVNRGGILSTADVGNVNDKPLKRLGTSMGSLTLMIKLSDEQHLGASTFGDNLLREYAVHLDPLNTNGTTHPEIGIDEAPQSGLSTASTQVGDSPHDFPTSLPSSPFFPLRAPKSFLGHKKGNQSIDSSIPHQSILKALVSRPPNNDSPPVSIAASLASLFNSPNDPQSRQSSSQHLSLGPLDLDKELKTPSTARFTSLQSPCFFHQRFDDAVNVDRVLEEIAAEDDGFSHGRLMQTATSVREISKQLQRRPIRRAVRTVMIVTKARDNSLVHLTRELAEWLLGTPRYNSDLGVTVYVDVKLQNSKRFNAASLVASNPRYEKMLRYWTPDLCWSSPEKFDLVLTLGGDGTVLYTSWLFQRIVPPILSFSLGSLGFLTNFQFAAYKPSLDRIMGEAGMRVNLRMRFTCTVYRAHLNNTNTRARYNGSKKEGEQEGQEQEDTSSSNELVEGEQFEVLNELVIDRGPSPYVSNLELYGDNELLTVVQADGCIFSTPTGSTAYSLSAGGPLTHPSIPGILLTPICPHTLSFRPMVLSDSLLLKVCVPRNSRSTAYASFDGKGRVELRRGDCVHVEAGKYPFPTVVGEGGTGGEWFESVRRALRWNTRGAVQMGFNSKAEGPGARVAKEDKEEDETWNGDNDEDGGEGEEEDWDINPDPIEVGPGGPDSGTGASEASPSSCASPPSRQGSLKS
ncbi:NAD(+) kinase [Schaereria dolodes]|nr:NAD(+) kinase [Schaereria dolodes]